MNLLGGLAVVQAAFLLSTNVAVTGYTESPMGRPIIFTEVVSEEEQIEMEIYDGERELLAQLVRAEAGNQSLEGKRLVADVVLNRVRSSEFPDTITEVIYQEGQFTVVGNGALDKAGWTVDEEDFEAVRLETEEAQLNTDILYFSRGKSVYGTNWFKVGAHWFGEGKD